MTGETLKRIVWGFIAAAIVLLLLYELYEGTRSMGRNVIAEIAKGRGLCQLDGCVDGIDYAEGVFVEKYEVSIARIEWCVGVDEWRKYRVYRGGLIKVIAIDIMNTPCNFLTATDKLSPPENP